MELDASTITRFIDALTTKKMIQKTSIRKGARYILTAEGKRIATEVSDLMDSIFTRMQGTLGKRDFENIYFFINNTNFIRNKNDGKRR